MSTLDNRNATQKLCGAFLQLFLRLDNYRKNVSDFQLFHSERGDEGGTLVRDISAYRWLIKNSRLLWQQYGSRHRRFDSIVDSHYIVILVRMSSNLSNELYAMTDARSGLVPFFFELHVYLREQQIFFHELFDFVGNFNATICQKPLVLNFSVEFTFAHGCIGNVARRRNFSTPEC